MVEEWRPIAGFEKTYFVSNLGRIRSERSWRTDSLFMKGSPSGRGYRKAILCAPGQPSVHKYIHDIVLETFVGPRPIGLEACHENGKRDDNRLENLRWDTRKNNHADKLRHGTDIRGEKHPRRKLTAVDVIAIRAETGTLAEIGARFGIGPMQVHRIKTRQNWDSLP